MALYHLPFVLPPSLPRLLPPSSFAFGLPETLLHSHCFSVRDLQYVEATKRYSLYNRPSNCRQVKPYFGQKRLDWHDITALTACFSKFRWSVGWNFVNSLLQWKSTMFVAGRQHFDLANISKNNMQSREKSCWTTLLAAHNSQIHLTHCRVKML